ncbi:MAG: RelA/SpoT family protein [Candidatus Nanoarchaeia archaeon]|nr:RelA/SpoT family protein [Candidatus Nanoarchaeia archaeon]
MEFWHYNEIFYNEYHFTLNDLLDRTSYLNKEEKKELERAYEFARNKHGNQKRVSGDEYIDHPLSVAIFLTSFNADLTTLQVALLHDVFEDTKTTLHEIKKEFNSEVEYLVEVLTKVKETNDLKDQIDAAKINYIKKILLGTIKDFRIILIKLCDRLHNLITLKYMDKETQKRIAKETLEVYAPIAAKLGIYNLKNPLEDLSFKYLYPEEYKDLKNQVGEKIEHRYNYVNQYIGKIRQLLDKYNYNYIIFGRAKNLYSIYNKIKNYGKSLENIYDLFGIRIMVDNIDECYEVTKIILSKWILKKGRYKDYIKDPKENGYKSIHLTLEPEEKKFIEVQIRTKQMNYENEYGLAAHWRYKGDEEDREFDKRVAWIKQVIDWKKEYADKNEFIRNLNVNLFKEEITVLTPKGDLIDLPKGSTPIDFAYTVHTSIGEHCKQSKVNGKIVPLNHELQNNDVVEIQVGKNINVSKQWLKFAKTNYVRQKVRRSLNMPMKHMIKKDEDENKLKILKISINNIEYDNFKLSTCCMPKIGDKVIAILENNIYTIHKYNCSNINLNQNNLIKDVKLIYNHESIINVKVVVNEKEIKLKQILNGIAKMNLDIISLSTQYKHNKLHIKLDFMLSDNLKDFLIKLKKEKGVNNLEVLNIDYWL